MYPVHLILGVSLLKILPFFGVNNSSLEKPKNINNISVLDKIPLDDNQYKVGETVQNSYIV